VNLYILAHLDKTALTTYSASQVFSFLLASDLGRESQVDRSFRVVSSLDLNNVKEESTCVHLYVQRDTATRFLTDSFLQRPFPPLFLVILLC
jgi:hypothetical protein